jgi:hypothetical protein
MTAPLRMISRSCLGAIALLAGCADTSPRGATPAATARAVSAAAPPAAVGTRFDGRYVGPAVLTNSRSNACGAQQQRRSITVVNGNVTYVVDQYRNLVVTGPVQRDGSVELVGATDLSSRVQGRMQDGSFSGQFVSSACVRSLDLHRAGP